MSTAKLRNWKVWVPALVVPMLLGGTVWAVAAHRRAQGQKDILPKELSAEALKAETNPGKIFEKIHNAAHQGNFTEEQRQQLRDNARSVVEARIDQRMNTYFAAKTDDEKNAILDRDIEDFQKFTKQMQERRAQWQREHPGEIPRGFFGRPGGGPPGPSTSGSPSASSGGSSPSGASANAGAPAQDGGRDGFRGGGRGAPTRQERKMRSESRSPDQRAKMMAYFSALHTRAQKRGITIPSFGGPH